MNREQVRVAFVNMIQPAIAALSPPPPVQWENRNIVDVSKQTAPWVEVAVVFGPGAQIGLGEHPLKRQLGTLVMLVRVKVGAGTSDAFKIAGALAEATELKTVGQLTTLAAGSRDAPVEDGWFPHVVTVPFHFDDVVT